MLKGVLITLILFLMTSCNFDNWKTAEEAEEVFARQAEVLATDLEIPWNVAKDDSTFYISQRPGYIVKVDGLTGAKTVQQIEVTKDIHHVGEGGLLGFILAPDFNNSREAIAYHTYREEGRVLNRIIVLEINQNRWSEKRVILERIPGGRIHNGGRLKIGPDGKLYATAGDAGNPDNAQNINSLAGKILRMNVNGSIPVDNPFQNSYIYSYGHRNPQGLAWNANGTMFSSEHGQSAHDEINLIEPGMNYGWPVIEGDQQASNMKTPFFHTGNVTWAPSGIEIKDNQLYVATLRGESIRVINLSDKTVDIAFENAGRIRDVFIEGSSMYTITNNRDGRGNPREGDDKLLKLSLGE